MQIGLAQRCVQAGLPWLNVQGLAVLLHGIFPTAALKQEITEKTMPPGRFTIQMRSPIGQTGRQVKVFVSEFEPGLGLVGIMDGDLTKHLGRVLEIFLAQVYRSQSLAGLAARWIKLQRTLEEGNGLFRGTQFKVIHSDDYGGAKQVRSFAQRFRQVPHC